MIETWTNGNQISVVTNSETTLSNFLNYKNTVLDVNDETKGHDNAQLLSYVISIYFNVQPRVTKAVNENVNSYAFVNIPKGKFLLNAGKRIMMGTWLVWRI